MVAFFLGAVDRALQAHGVPDVAVVKGDVVVAHQHQIGVGHQLFTHPTAQAFEPFHLVFKLVAAGLLAIGEIGANDPHALHGARDHAGHVVIKAGDVFDHIRGRGARQQGHAVVGLLTKPLRLVACIQKGLGGKLVVRHLQLLQHQYIDRVGAKPIQHLWQTHA